MADVVFIIGAGCSVHAGAPIMANFLDRARDLWAAGEVTDRKQEFETTFKVVSHLQRVHSKARLDHNNVEAVFAAVDLAGTLRKLPGFQPEEIEAARKALVWMIVRTLEESINFETMGGYLRGTEEYRKFGELIGELKARGPSLSSAILTFNYDVAMDLSFAVAGLQYSYGLHPDERGVPLLKLHGSLNWARTKDEKRTIVPCDMATYQKKIRREWFKQDDNPKRPTKVTKNCMVLLRELKHDVEDEPVLIPPTWSKGEYYREIANVWSRAARELEGARHIFVLGYSLPETDQFFRLLFALGTEGPEILSKIAIFDPFPDGVELRFREMLGQAALDRFEVHRSNFGQGIQLIEQMLFATGKRRSR